MDARGIIRRGCLRFWFLGLVGTEAVFVESDVVNYVALFNLGGSSRVTVGVFLVFVIAYGFGTRDFNSFKVLQAFLALGNVIRPGLDLAFVRDVHRVKQWFLK